VPLAVSGALSAHTDSAAIYLEGFSFILLLLLSGASILHLLSGAFPNRFSRLRFSRRALTSDQNGKPTYNTGSYGAARYKNYRPQHRSTENIQWGAFLLSGMYPCPAALLVLVLVSTLDAAGNGVLSGCGVGFKFMQAFAKNNGIPFSRLIPMLDLCAVSIAADLVQVEEENRILAFHGLKQLNQNPSLGLKAIIDICGLSGKEISMSDIVFKIGPRINASGRMESGKESVSLLVEKDYNVALQSAKHINEYNEQRKDIDKQMTEEANQIVARLESQKKQSSIVLYDENWKKGVIGIVASRLTEIYFRPTVVITRDGDFATGSARSVMGFDIYSAIKSCRDLLINFGGHTYAAGLTMRWDDVPRFVERFHQYVDCHILPEQTEAILHIDEMIDFKDITKKMHHDLKKFSPFGPGNLKPRFCTNNVYDYGTSKVVGREQEHIKLELIDSKSSNVVNGIAFGQSASARYIKSKRSFDIAYTIEDNVFRHNNIQLQIEDIRLTENEEQDENNAL